MELTSEEKEMLDGEQGEGCRMAMSILVRMAEIYEADELIPIVHAHIDGCGMLSDAGLEFAEMLAAKGAKVSVPTTLSMGPLDHWHWREQGIDEAYAQKAIRQANAYEGMGCIPAWTCAPYQGYATPRFGQQVAWGESNAVVYANSVLGARTNRYADFIDICAAITGRAPKCGLHLSENRKGQALFDLKNIPVSIMREDKFYPALGNLIGKLSENLMPIIDGLPAEVTDDQLKTFGAALASTGPAEMFHAVGITPEAPTLKAALHFEKPQLYCEITQEDIDAAVADLSTTSERGTLNYVVLGCPHYSYAEFEQLVSAIEKTNGQKAHPDVQFVVITSRQTLALLNGRPAWKQLLKEFGVTIAVDTCVMHTPILRGDGKTLMTDSGKCAYYAPGDLDLDVVFGSQAECVNSAVTGQVSLEESLWQSK